MNEAVKIGKTNSANFVVLRNAVIENAEKVNVANGAVWRNEAIGEC